MLVEGRLCGAAELVRRYHVGATIADAGIIVMDAGTQNGPIPCTTTSMLDALGMAQDVATYSATPALGALGTSLISWAPDNLYRAAMSGGAAENTALTVMTETAGDTATPDLVTSTDAQANDMDSGTVWRLQPPGNPAGLSDYRIISAHTASVSVGFIVDLESAINVGDQFLMCPWSHIPLDGTANEEGNLTLQTTTLFTQADATIATGTGAEVNITDLIMRSATDSQVVFKLRDHVYLSATPDV